MQAAIAEVENRVVGKIDDLEKRQDEKLHGVNLRLVEHEKRAEHTKSGLAHTINHVIEEITNLKNQHQATESTVDDLKDGVTLLDTKFSDYTLKTLEAQHRIELQVTKAVDENASNSYLIKWVMAGVAGTLLSIVGGIVTLLVWSVTKS